MDDSKSKDIQEYVRLVATNERRIYGYILAMVLSHQDADDILQETLIYTWNEFDKYRPGTNFGAWAMSVARYRILDYLRNKKLERQVVLTNTLVANFHDEVRESTDDMDDYLDTLQYCVKKLNADDRTLLTERYQKNYSVKEIAEAAGVTVQNVYQKLSRIQVMLYRCVKRALAV